MPDATAMKQLESRALHLLNKQIQISASTREAQLLTEEQKKEMYYLPWSHVRHWIDAISSIWSTTKIEAEIVLLWLEQGAIQAVCIIHSGGGQWVSFITLHC